MPTPTVIRILRFSLMIVRILVRSLPMFNVLGQLIPGFKVPVAVKIVLMTSHLRDRVHTISIQSYLSLMIELITIFSAMKA